MKEPDGSHAGPPILDPGTHDLSQAGARLGARRGPDGRHTGPPILDPGTHDPSQAGGQAGGQTGARRGPDGRHTGPPILIHAPNDQAITPITPVRTPEALRYLGN